MRVEAVLEMCVETVLEMCVMCVETVLEMCVMCVETALEMCVLKLAGNVSIDKLTHNFDKIQKTNTNRNHLFWTTAMVPLPYKT